MKSFSPKVEVRAVIEGQFLAKLSHAKSLGYEITSSSRVLATGGGSENEEILQVSMDFWSSSQFPFQQKVCAVSGVGFCIRT